MQNRGVALSDPPRTRSAHALCPRCGRELPPLASSCSACGALAVAAARDLGLGDLLATGPRDPLIGSVVNGRFLIEELVGQGGMGKVYRARHLALDKAVCLKMLKPALLEDPTLVGRFEREAKAASRLNHPNSIAVLDFGKLPEEGGTLYIVMEYVDGKDLRQVLRDEGPLPEARLCAIMAQVLSALGEAHAQNVIHRDLKPENIMVEQRRDQLDFVKVLDFGIAKILDSDMPGLTRSDLVCGTPQYMAPEQATGSALDHRCDLYAVGVILYQLVTGDLPFDGATSMEVLTKHVNDPPIAPRKRLATVSAPMEAIILRALSKDPAQRPQTAAQFREELLAVPALARGAALHHDTIPTLPPPHQEDRPEITNVLPPPPARQGSRRAAAIGLGLLLAVIAAAAWTRLHAAKPLSAPPSAPPSAVPVTPTPAAVAPAPPTALPSKPHDPARAKELVTRAAQWQKDGDTATARDLLEQAVELDPDNAEAHYRLGTLFLSSQPQRARAEYEASSRLDPGRYRNTVREILEGL